jgi:hypothetical protein
MNLEQLMAAGAMLPNSLVKKTVTWKHRDDDKKMMTDIFDVHVKKDMSAADLEFIHLNGNEHEGIMARRVSRLILLGEDGSERISFAVAASLQPGLLLSLCEAINAVEKENLPEDVAEKN